MEQNYLVEESVAVSILKIGSYIYIYIKKMESFKSIRSQTEIS